MKPRKNKTGGHQVYDDSLKIAVARDYLTGNLSLAQVAEKHNMPGKKDTVGHFVKWYRKHYQSKPLQTDSSPPVVNDIDQPKSSKELEKELLKDGKKGTMETSNFCNCSNIAQLYQKNYLFPLRIM